MKAKSILTVNHLYGFHFLLPKLCFSIGIYEGFGNLFYMKEEKVSPNVGLEPTTPRLRVSCSTD